MTNSADLASCESADIQRRILELIEGASSIAISGHTSPDGDALGSVLGLGLSLMKFFPNKDIALLLADDDPVPRIYRFMEGSDRLVPASAYTGNPDLFITFTHNGFKVEKQFLSFQCFGWSKVFTIPYFPLIIDATTSLSRKILNTIR